MPALQPATLSFNSDGTPISAAFDDVYHSASGPRGPWGQAEEVFLKGNGLTGDDARWRGQRHFTILETGFGLGLSFIATVRAWLNDPQRGNWLHFVSLEKHPFLKADLATLWQRLAEDSTSRALADELITQWPLPVPGLHRLVLAQGRIRLTLAFGDAETLLPKLSLRANALFLDGFAPRKNPDLWSPRIFASLAKLCARDATFATWSASSDVREGLVAAGFDVTRTQGYAGKRHQLQGRYTGFVRPPAFVPRERHALIIGAGLAGCGITATLAARGWRIDLFDEAPGPAQAASGNLAGSFHPVMTRDDNLLARLTRNAFLNNLLAWKALHARKPFAWQQSGALQLASERRRGAGLPPVDDWPTELVRAADTASARELTGAPLREGGLWFPDAGWLTPPSLCAAQLADAGDAVQAHYASRIARIRQIADGWQVMDVGGKVLGEAPVLILANAQPAASLLPDHALPLAIVRGQVSLLDAQDLPDLKACICGSGYLLPPVNGRIVIGATYAPGDSATDVRDADHQDNLRRVAEALEFDPSEYSQRQLAGRASLRCVTPDRLPVIGALPDPARPGSTPSRLPRLPGLYVASGFASRGILWGSLAGEHLAALLEGEPLPMETDLAAAIDPARFAVREAKRETTSTPAPAPTQE